MFPVTILYFLAHSPFCLTCAWKKKNHSFCMLTFSQRSNKMVFILHGPCSPLLCASVTAVVNVRHGHALEEQRAFLKGNVGCAVRQTEE